MAQFTDNQGRTWTLTIDVNAARKVRHRCGVNILDTQAGLPKLSEDTILLIDVLYVLCEEQARQHKVSDEEFGRALVGDAIDEAGKALIEALLLFFPARQRAVLEQMRATGQALQEFMAAVAAEKLPPAIARLRELTSGVRSPAPPASSDSTPDPSPSAS